MSFDDWIIALHVLSAFSLVAGSILFWAVIWAVRQIDTPADKLRLGPLAKVGNATVTERESSALMIDRGRH